MFTLDAMFRNLLRLGMLCAATASTALAAPPFALRAGVAGHAFDHLGGISDQAEAAAASGANIIYGSGVGVFGYQGLPPETELAKAARESLAYTTKAKSRGIELAIGYICATSIVGLETFDRHWTPEFRAQFHTPPAQWRQQDQHGNPLPSWYGGKYEAACMNNPDWRAYEKAMVRRQLNIGCDGIFFDNPTVHSQGCYCPFCMEKFNAFLAANNHGPAHLKPPSIDALRQQALNHPREFLQFRGAIARDFLAEMRVYARSLKRGALITCNNSLNSADALFLQCHTYGYNIYELSQAEDFVVVEDMSSQPRVLANGRTIEYGPTYKQLHAISHGKPVVAVTLADADYHTAPDLVRLAMAEAAANESSYLLWPTWPENVRQKMAASIRPEAELLRREEKLLNDAQPRQDVLLLLCFRRWLDTDTCVPSALAAALGRANIQHAVTSEDDLEKSLKQPSPKPPVLLIERLSDLNEKEKQSVAAFQQRGGRVVEANQSDWLKQLQQTIKQPSLILEAAPAVRAVVADQRNRTIVHLYNLGVERLSSFEDRVHPVRDVRLTLRVPFKRVHSIRALTADTAGTSGPLEFTAQTEGKETLVKLIVPHLEIATMLVIAP